MLPGSLLQVQFAKARELHVTATCGPTNVDRVRELGADEVVDYSKVSALI